MLILPSIDLLDGKCVRLYRGRYSESTVYAEDPVRVAAELEKAGARWIHLVDLDAARDSGKPNRSRISEIRAAVSASLEVGGGVRSRRDVEELLAIGVDRVVVGTVLVTQPEAAAAWAEEFGEVIVGAVDAVDGAVRIKGWEGEGQVRDVDLAASLAGLGIRGVIYTSIAQDGTLAGPDVQATNRVAAASGLPVILSGGIGSEADVEAVHRERHRGVVGLIVGRAYYEGRISLSRVLERHRSEEDDSW